MLVSDSGCAVFKMDSKQNSSSSGEENAKPIKQFSVKEVSSWITTNFDERMAEKFEGEFF